MATSNSRRCGRVKLPQLTCTGLREAWPVHERAERHAWQCGAAGCRRAVLSSPKAPPHWKRRQRAVWYTRAAHVLSAALAYSRQLPGDRMLRSNVRLRASSMNTRCLAHDGDVSFAMPAVRRQHSAARPQRLRRRSVHRLIPTSSAQGAKASVTRIFEPLKPTTRTRGQCNGAARQRRAVDAHR